VKQSILIAMVNNKEIWDVNVLIRLARLQSRKQVDTEHSEYCSRSALAAPEYHELKRHISAPGNVSAEGGNQ
jgi:hypothetical protein